MFGLRKYKKRDNGGEIEKRRSMSPMEKFQRNMNSVFEEFFSDWEDDFSPLDSLASSKFMPITDVKEDNATILVETELPGIDKEDINIEIKNGVLKISGEKKCEKEEKGKHAHKTERSYGYFERSIRLSSDVEEEKIKATCKDGVLKIELPKKETSEAKKKRIQIQ